MPRKTSEIPTRIYSYSADAPTTNQDLVEQQFQLAHQFRNALVEVKRRLRDRIEEIWLADPLVHGPVVYAKEAEAAVDCAYDDVRAAKSGTATPDLTQVREILTRAKELRSIMWDELKAVKKAAMDRDEKLDLADPVVGPLRTQHEAARAALTAAKKAKVGDGEEKALKKVADAARKEWQCAHRLAEEEGRLPVDQFRVAHEVAHDEQVKKRNEFQDRGLRHGAYNRVELAVNQAANSTKRPLIFERYDGTGSIGTQLTETGVGVRRQADPDAEGVGLTWPELTSQLDTRLRLGSPGQSDKRPPDAVVGKQWADVPALGRNVRRHAARTYVDLRVSTEPDGRTPIFARFPVVLHRLPPKDSVIKWAYVVRKRVGHQFEWRFQLTIESPTFDRPHQVLGSGTCAVNLGWRRIVDDEGAVVGLRAAYVVDEHGKEREIRVPDYRPDRRGGKKVRARPPAPRVIPVLSAVGKCHDLAAIRDKAMDRALEALSQWLKDRGNLPESWSTLDPRPDGLPHAPGPDGKLPRTLADRLGGWNRTHRLAWRAPWKLHTFVKAWRARRVPGDELIFDALHAWTVQDHHLETWQANQREGIIGRRREEWRLVATELARTYDTILVGESKLPQIDGWERPDPDEGDPSDGREQRRMSRLCAPGELREEIKKAAHKTGARVILHEEKRATQQCYYCEHAEPWDAKPSITHECENCGRTWDQDANYGRNLLKRYGKKNGGDTASGPAPSSGGKPLAEDKPAKSRRKRDAEGNDATQVAAP